MSRVQLALNVDNLEESIGFYSKLFSTDPAKVRPGYANFAVAEPPLKLVLIENPGQGGSINHLGVEVPDTDTVDAEQIRLAGAGFAVLVTDVRDLADVPAVVRRLADAAGVPVPSIEAPVGSATEWASAIVPIWRRPWMLLGPGTYGASVLAALGVDVWSPTGGRYDEVALDDLAAAERADGDLFLLAPTEPYAFREAHLAELAAAAPTATVHVVDGQDLFWWGTRTPGALTRLRTQLRPSL